MAAPPPAQLVFGLAPLAMTGSVASALAGIRQSHPPLAVTLQVIGRDAVPAVVAAGNLDLGLVGHVAIVRAPRRVRPGTKGPNRAA
jgi:hypothetical protein